MTRVVNLKRAEYEVYIGRAGKGHSGYFGNPHPVGLPCELCDGTIHGHGQAIELFRSYFLKRVEDDPEFRRRVLALRGKVLGCFCKPRPCHGDVIVGWLETQP
jgi:hypothetical protein